MLDAMEGLRLQNDMLQESVSDLQQERSPGAHNRKQHLNGYYQGGLFTEVQVDGQDVEGSLPSVVYEPPEVLDVKLPRFDK